MNTITNSASGQAATLLTPTVTLAAVRPTPSSLILPWVVLVSDGGKVTTTFHASQEAAIGYIAENGYSQFTDTSKGTATYRISADGAYYAQIS